MAGQQKKHKRNPSAEKAHRRSLKNRAHNRHHLSTLRTAVKGFRDVLTGGTAGDIDAALPALLRVVSSTATKGIIHANTASRLISRLSAQADARKAGLASA